MAASTYRESSVVDIGSGGGVPGVVIAILRPDLSVTLVDSDRRKTGIPHPCCGFAEAAQRDRGVDSAPRTPGTETACARGSTWRRHERPRHRRCSASSRCRCSVSAARCAHWLQNAAAASFACPPPPWRAVGMLPKLPRTGCCACRKVAPTPDAYPRRPGTPNRHPISEPAADRRGRDRPLVPGHLAGRGLERLLVPLARAEHRVPRRSVRTAKPIASSRSGMTNTFLPRTPPAATAPAAICSRMQLPVLVARILVGDHADVCEPRGHRPHRRAASRGRVRRRSRRPPRAVPRWSGAVREHRLERVGRVRIVDHHRVRLAEVDALHPSRDRVGGFEASDRAAKIAPVAHAAPGPRSALRTLNGPASRRCTGAVPQGVCADERDAGRCGR